MQDVTLLSNGTYHVAVTSRGSSWSTWKGLAVTRRREDAVLDGGGAFVYLTDADKGFLGSLTTRPTGLVHDGGTTRSICVDGQASFSHRVHKIEALTHVAVAIDDDVELRRVRLTNLSSQTRRLSATSFAEIVLSPPATDSAHLAFSKLFVETEIDGELRAIVATRRPTRPENVRSWLFHQPVALGGSGTLSYETDRMRFIGRGRNASEPAALLASDHLSGHAGPVLDAVAAIRVPLTIEAGGSCTVDWFTGLAVSRRACVGLARKYRTEGAGDRLMAQAGTFRQSTLRRINASDAEGLVYERLACLILYSGALRADASEIAKNRRGQSALWRFGLSGDLPIVLLRGAKSDEVEVVLQLVRAHAFWSACGLKTEMMIVSERAGSGLSMLAQVQQVLADSVGDAVIGKPGGIFLRDDATLDDGDRTLLNTVARIVVTGSAGSLAEQLDRSERRHGRAVDVQSEPHVAQLPISPAPSPAATAASDKSPAWPEPDNLLFFNGYGGFAPTMREYVIVASTDHMTPAPWTNVIANPGFGTLVSESGSASTWSENAHEFRLTPWSNDPVSDPNTEAFYIRDEDNGHFWSPTLLPTRHAGAHVARHGFGYSTFEHTEEGIESALRVYVAIDAPVKFCALTLRNCSGRARRLSVTGYLDWVLGDERAKTLAHVVTELDEDSGAVFARNGYNTDFVERTAFFDVDGTDRSACGDRADFFGPFGTLANPAALAQTRLSGRLGAALDPCAALRVSIDLAAGEEREVGFRLGAGKSKAEARELVRRWQGPAAAHEALAAVEAYWHTTLGAIQVRTPDPTVDALANGWLLYQVIASRLWGRTAFYQSSGAFGFRDQLQDVMALVHAEPALVREHLLRSASRQFPEGDVQHWWHPPSGKGVRTRCSDDYLWLAFVTSRYVEVTGAATVLEVSCPFLEARTLNNGEQSDMSSPKVSAQTASLYEHCVRAIRHGLRYGTHGLPLMGMGDWNDGMNLVGAGGQGESVWLAFFLIPVLKRFAPLARARSDAEFAELCTSEAATLGERVETTAWDGAWYRRAYFDDGTPLGSVNNAECRIDSIAQSWSVLSGAAPAERARMAMASVDPLPVHRDARLVQLIDPPFDKSNPSPGYIQGYVPGVRENGRS